MSFQMGFQRFRFLLVSLCGAVLTVGGCTSLPGSAVTESGGGRVEFAESRGATPVVVFESGIGSYKEVWNKVVPAVSATNAVFAHNRPGVGGSDPTGRPRDGAAIVEELRALLAARRLSPPYVLVGHSAGGLYTQSYARRYPDEVAGLVLLDPTHPTQFDGDGALSKRPALSSMAVALALSGNVRQEFDALTETGREVLAAPPLRTTIPTIILIAPDLPDAPMAAFDNAKRADFIRLYPHAIIRTVEGGHMVPQEQPQAVVQAIAEVLRLARRS